MQCDECMHLEGYTEGCMAMCHEFRSEGGFVKESRFLRPMPEDGDCPRFRAFRPEKGVDPSTLPRRKTMREMNVEMWRKIQYEREETI